MVCDDDLKSPLIKLFEGSWIYKFLGNVSFIIHFSILLCISLIVLSLISVGLIPYIQSLLGLGQITNSDLLSSSTTIVLISITGVYVLFTYGLVKENQRTTEQYRIDRKISIITKQLTDFYYPLLYSLEYQVTYNEEDEVGPILRKDVSIADRTQMVNNPMFKSILKNRGFALNIQTRELLDKYILMLHTNSWTRDVEYLKAYDNLKKYVNEDILELTKKLEELTE